MNETELAFTNKKPGCPALELHPLEKIPMYSVGGRGYLRVHDALRAVAKAQLREWCIDYAYWYQDQSREYNDATFREGCFAFYTEMFPPTCPRTYDKEKERDEYRFPVYHGKPKKRNFCAHCRQEWIKNRIKQLREAAGL